MAGSSGGGDGTEGVAVTGAAAEATAGGGAGRPISSGGDSAGGDSAADADAADAPPAAAGAATAPAEATFAARSLIFCQNLSVSFFTSA